MFHPLFLLAAVLCSSAVAFAPPACMTTHTFTHTCASTSTNLAMSDMRADDTHNTKSNNSLQNAAVDTEGIAMMLPLVIKLAGVMTIKTAKDVVNYPPKMMEKVLNQKQTNNSNNELEKMSPFVMLFKLLGVLVFKTGHDMVYFPALWAKRLAECQSLDECDISDL